MNRLLWPCLVAALLLSPLVALAADNLIVNGDFELEAPDSPPAGWSMWGADQYKVPANYTRDTTNPHSGQACFRLYHPANTSGYIVSAPDKAVLAKPGMMVTVSFWARTDQPGPSSFLFTSYESMNPFRDAPSPGRYVINVGQEWQQFTFTVYEGWDYFAERSKLIMLTFIPTPDQKLEKTLWIDDVSLTQEPTTKPGRMVDEHSLQYEPLQHRLTAGTALAFSVDATRPLRPATREVGGISFHRVVGWTGEPYNKQGEYTLNKQVEEAIAALNLPMTRVYAVGDEPFGLEGAIDRVAELVGKVGIPQDKTVLELETQGATTKLAPEVWAQAARYVQQKGYKFHYWEISNEPYIRLANSAFPTSEDYASHVIECAKALRAVNPRAQIGMGITEDQRWGNYLLKRAAGSYDFVAGHYYAVSDVMNRKFEPVVLGENYRTLDRILQVNALLKEYNPGRSVYQFDTEWGMISSGLKGEEADYVDRNANITGVLHRAVRLIYYAREGMLRGASSWQMLNRLNAQGFGIVFQQAPEKRSMLYWLYYYFNRHVGEQVLKTEGTAPFYTVQGDSRLANGSYSGPLTPALVTLSKDRKTMYAVIANGSWDQTVPCEMTWKGFRAAGSEAYQLSSDNLDAKPLLDDDQAFVSLFDPKTTEGGLTCDVPPHSVTFIRIEAK
ncbi:MAG: hypothetical protein WCP21_14690 [Armatimonadota bacterium]